MNSDQLSAIEDLGRTIAFKEAEMGAARVERDAAQLRETECRLAMSGIEHRLYAIGKDVHREGEGVYLNGQALDRGILQLGNEALAFSGWRGSISVALASIVEIDISTSNLPGHAGIPIVEGLWPGAARRAETLVMSIARGDSIERRLVVIADLREAAAWRGSIESCKARLGEVTANREDLVRARGEATEPLALADAALKHAQARLQAIMGELARLKAQLAEANQARVRLETIARQQALQEARRSLATPAEVQAKLAAVLGLESDPKPPQGETEVRHYRTSEDSEKDAVDQDREIVATRERNG